MKAVAVFPATQEVKLIDIDEPQVRSPNEVKVRMLEVGICGTDREIVSFQYGTPPPGQSRLVIGHESLGQVVEVGEQATRVGKGDLVVIMVRRPCPHPDCIACRAGRPDFCYTGDFSERGIKGLDGFMTEFVVDDEQYMNRVPGELREVAVLTEPTTIAEKGMIQVWDVQARLPWGCARPPGSGAGGPAADHSCHRAVVLGAGPVGLLGAMVIAQAGFKTHIYSLEPTNSPQAQFARQIGADYIVSSAVAPAQLAEQVGNIDLVYEATGVAPIAFEVLQSLGANGVFIFTGVPGRRGPVELPAGAIMRNMVLKNQLIYGTVNADRVAFESAIRDLDLFTKRWPGALRSLITQRYPLTDFQTPLLQQRAGIKNVIEIS